VLARRVAARRFRLRSRQEAQARPKPDGFIEETSGNSVEVRKRAAAVESQNQHLNQDMFEMRNDIKDQTKESRF